MKNEKLSTLLILVDEPISSDKNSEFTHALEILKQSFKVEFINAQKTPESELIQQIKKSLPTLSIGKDKLRLVDSPVTPPQNLKEFKKRPPRDTKPIHETTKALLDSFQTRYHDAQLQIRQLEVKIEQMLKSGGNSNEVKELRLRMDALANRQKAWLKALTETLHTYKTSPKKPKGKT